MKSDKTISPKRANVTIRVDGVLYKYSCAINRLAKNSYEITLVARHPHTEETHVKTYFKYLFSCPATKPWQHYASFKRGRHCYEGGVELVDARCVYDSSAFKDLFKRYEKAHNEFIEVVTSLRNK